MSKALDVITDLLFNHLELAKTENDLFDFLEHAYHARLLYLKIVPIFFLALALFCNTAFVGYYSVLSNNILVWLSVWLIVELSLVVLFIWYPVRNWNKVKRLDKELSTEFIKRVTCVSNDWELVSREERELLDSRINDHIIFIQAERNEVSWKYKGKYCGNKWSFEYVVYEVKMFSMEGYVGRKTGILVLDDVGMEPFRNTCITNQSYEPYALMIRHSEDEDTLKSVNMYTNTPNTVAEAVTKIYDHVHKLADFDECSFDINDYGAVTMQFNYKVSCSNPPSVLLGSSAQMELSGVNEHKAITWALEYIENILDMRRTTRPQLRGV